MLPGAAAGRIDQGGRRDQKAETQPGAGVPRGSQAEIGPGREGVGARAEEAEAGQPAGVPAPADVAFDPDQPARRELPIVAEIAAQPRRLHVEWFLGHERRVQARRGPDRDAANEQLLDEIRRRPFGIGGAQPGIGAEIKAGPTGNGWRGRNRRRLDRQGHIGGDSPGGYQRSSRRNNNNRGFHGSAPTPRKIHGLNLTPFTRSKCCTQDTVYKKGAREYQSERLDHRPACRPKFLEYTDPSGGPAT